MSFRHVVAGLLLAVVPAAAQKAPRFEVASIRPTPAEGSQGTPAPVMGMRVTGTQIRLSRLSLKDYIGMAYSLDPPQVIAPEWTGEQRWEISATLPDGTTREQIPEMLQTLLAERFQLKVRKESREFPVYALTVGQGGLKIKATPVDPNAPPLVATETTGAGSQAGVVINMGPGTFSLANRKLDVRQLTMPDIALALTRFSERKTIDATGLAGRFDFTLDLSQQDYSYAMVRAAVNNGYPVAPEGRRFLDTAPSNVLGQYIATTGLVLEERSAPLDVIVVDSVSKTPTEN